MTNEYMPVIGHRFADGYFQDENNNNIKRLTQFVFDEKFIKLFIFKGSICDVGCSTGELLSSIKWAGDFYGIEIHEYAKGISSDIIQFEK